MKNGRYLKLFKKDYICNYGILVLAIGFLYTMGPVIAAATGTIDKTLFQENSKLIVIAIIAIFLFLCGYNMPFSLAGRKTDMNYNHWILKIILLITFAIYVVIKVSMMRKIGFMSYFTLGRASTKKMILENYSYIGMFDTLMQMLCAFSLEMYFESKKKGKRGTTYFVVFLAIFSVGCLFAVLEADRSNLLVILLPIIFLLNYHKILSNKIIVFSGIALFAIFFVWKEMLSYLFSSTGTGGLSISIAVPAELFTWFIVGADVNSSLKENNQMYQFGYTYLKAFESLINPIGQHYESLSTWYARTFHYANYLQGGGYGFSCIVESILNFGNFGAALVFIPFGVIIKGIESKMENSVYWRCFYALSLAFVYKIFRSEIYSIVKLSFWLWAIPLVGLFMVGSLIKFTK